MDIINTPLFLSSPRPASSLHFPRAIKGSHHPLQSDKGDSGLLSARSPPTLKSRPLHLISHSARVAAQHALTCIFRLEMLGWFTVICKQQKKQILFQLDFLRCAGSFHACLCVSESADYENLCLLWCS